MSDYPSHNISLRSERVPVDETVDDFGQGLTHHSRTLGPTNVWQFNVIHHLTLAELLALEALYDAGPRDNLTNFRYFPLSPEVTYTVKFLRKPRAVINHGGDVFSVLVNLRGTQD